MMLYSTATHLQHIKSLPVGPTILFNGRVPEVKDQYNGNVHVAKTRGLGGLRCIL